MGVFHPDLVGIQARVLQQLGSRHVMVVHGANGLDEISPCGETLVAELKDGAVREYRLRPARFGIEEIELADIQAEEPAVAKQMLLDSLTGHNRAARDVVALNAGAAIYTAGVADSHEAGVRKSLEVISSGAARSKLDEYVAFTQKFKSD
jgi:anthranilate phosphoribosyltransferase